MQVFMLLKRKRVTLFFPPNCDISAQLLESTHAKQTQSGSLRIAVLLAERSLSSYYTSKQRIGPAHCFGQQAHMLPQLRKSSRFSPPPPPLLKAASTALHLHSCGAFDA